MQRQCGASWCDIKVIGGEVKSPSMSRASVATERYTIPRIANAQRRSLIIRMRRLRNVDECQFPVECSACHSRKHEPLEGLGSFILVLVC